MSKAETKKFQAETQQLLDLMIHSIYSNKEIFMRELISNSSDAIDKLKFEAIEKPELIKKDTEYHIRIEIDEKNRILKVSDNGIGMSKDEVISNLGTIAKSGTKELLEKMKKKESGNLSDLIGQFGVGFYSAFMIADKIEVNTCRAGESKGTKWESTGGEGYSVSEGERTEHGTEVALHLKPVDSDAGIEDYTQSWTVQSVIKKYSDFISYPIKMQEEKEEPELDKDGKPVEGGKSKKVIEDKTLNSMKPIWQRSKSSVKPEEYTEFYKHISHDWADPLDVISLSVEGRFEYKALMYLPSKAPFDLFYRNPNIGLQLYIKKVMIMESCDELLPAYLRFVKGVVESSDLPLNISREILQKDIHIAAIRKRLTKKIIDVLKKMKEKEYDTKFLTFWKEFGSALKEGISSDFENKETLEKLLLFQSTNDTEKLTDLESYVSRMKKDQKEIYFITGESRSQLENSPHLEVFREKEYEVLFLTDPVDEFLAQTLSEFDKKPFKSAAKSGIELESGEDKDKTEKELKKKEEEFKDLLAFLKESLKEQIGDVKISTRLIASPACLVGGENDVSPHLEKILQQVGQGAPQSKRTMELNSEHAVVKNLKAIFAKDAKDKRLTDFADLLLGYALIAEGSEVHNPAKFNKLLSQMMSEALS